MDIALHHNQLFEQVRHLQTHEFEAFKTEVGHRKNLEVNVGHKLDVILDKLSGIVPAVKTNPTNIIEIIIKWVGQVRGNMQSHPIAWRLSVSILTLILLLVVLPVSYVLTRRLSTPDFLTAARHDTSFFSTPDGRVCAAAGGAASQCGALTGTAPPIDIVLQLSTAATVYYAVVPAGYPTFVKARDVQLAATNAQSTSLASSAACGLFKVPRGFENFTLSITPTSDSEECQGYAAATRDLEVWAAARCSRCPSLLPDTDYEVRGRVGG